MSNRNRPSTAILILLFLLALGLTIWGEVSQVIPTHAYEEDEPVTPKQSIFKQQDAGEISGEYLKVIITPEQQAVLLGGHSRFTVVVLNISESVDLIDVSVNSPLVPDCNKKIGNLAANSNFAPYSCTLLNVQAPFINEVTVQGKNPVNNILDSAGTSAAVDLLDLEINVIPHPASIPEPGGNITITVNISNTGNVDVNLSTLTSLPFGDLTDNKNPKLFNNSCVFGSELPTLPANGEPFLCSFVSETSGQPGEKSVIISTRGGEDSYGNTLEKSGGAKVQITDVPASMSLSLTPEPAMILAPGGLVSFTVDIENSSLVDSITIESLTDSIIGDINNQGSCSLPQQLQAGSSYNCEYAFLVSGKSMENKSITLNAVGVDDDLTPGPVRASVQAEVKISQPEIFSIFLPLTTNFVEEPNNDCTEVFPLSLNFAYYFMPNDTFDLYSFNLPEVGDVTVNLTEFLPVMGQLIVYQDTGEGCENAKVLKNNADQSKQKILLLGTLEPGKYYIIVLNEGAPNQTIPYRLEIIFEKFPVAIK